MTREEVLSNLKNIVEEVLDLEDLQLEESTTAADVEDWDSIMHVEIIVAVEDHFNVKFSTMEIEGFQNVGNITDGIIKKLS